MSTILERIQRMELAKVFKDGRSLRAFEAIQDQVISTPEEIQAVQDAADAAQGTGNNAQAGVNLLKLPTYLVLTLTGTLTNERRLVGGAGVSIADGGANGDATLSVNVVVALGYTPANAAGQAFTGNVSAPNLTTPGTLDAGALKVAATGLSASATASDHSIPIDVGGTTYYIRLSATP